MTSLSRNSSSSPRFEIVIASTNSHKLREFRFMMKHLAQFDVLSLADFPNYVSPEETGTTFEENAILKATTAAKNLNRWVLADDSGLVVPALGGAPGIFSARYAGLNATDFENRKKLLDQMQYLMEEDRQAFYECCLSLASPAGLKKCVKGTCEGALLSQDRGGSGFGYDPLFVKHGYSKSFAEIDESIKNRISHRRKALDKMILSLESMVSSA
ncbi:MAG: RdgB/HAM1 family non-canonical purine NTP pyrophosphatase [Chlamydiota bacterium]